MDDEASKITRKSPARDSNLQGGNSQVDRNCLEKVEQERVASNKGERSRDKKIEE